jgi:hypothetical protein
MTLGSFGLTDAASVASIVVLLIVIFQVAYPVLAARQRRRPFMVHFAGPGPVDVIDGDRNQMTIQLGVDAQVEMRIRPTTRVEVIEMIFGFEGALDETPTVVEASNSFIARGMRRSLTPETTVDHYVDNKGRYHIRETRELAPPHVLAIGFMVRPKAVGLFQVTLKLMTHEGISMGQNPLYVRVVEPPPADVGDASPSA